MSQSPSYLDSTRPGSKPPKPKDHPGIGSLTLILLTIVAIGIVYGLCMLLVSSVMNSTKEHTTATQKRILYAIDPAALLAACKQLAVDGSGQIDSASSSVPPIIHRLDPKTITIADGRVVLECGGIDHQFGVIADVASTNPSTQPTPAMAVRELTSGLWYYAEDGAAPPP